METNVVGFVCCYYFFFWGGGGGGGLRLFKFQFLWKTSTVKPVLNGHSKRRPKFGFQDRLSLNASQKYSAILSTFIKLPFVFKTFVLSFFEWLSKTGFTV